MAQFFPKVLPNKIQDSERKVWFALESLSHDWRVFHSVTWQAPRNGREGDGEADFIVYNPQFGILVLEVKGGSISVEEGKWFTTDRHSQRHEIKNPFDQAVHSKHALIHFLSTKSTSRTVPVSHAVVFPDVRVHGQFGLYPREIICDATDLSKMSTWIRKVFNHWGATTTLSETDSKTLTNLLAPTVQFKRLLIDAIDESESQIIQLTNQQIAAFSMIRQNRNAVIVGAAGTGKTILAVERAKRAAEEGFDTLLLCFNSPLADYLSLQVKGIASIRACTFHSLCAQAARALGRNLPKSFDDPWWENQAMDTLIEGCEISGNRYNAIIVDEAQDFKEEWMTALRLLPEMERDSLFYVFTDLRQQLYRTEAVFPDWPTFTLDLNCRNTLPIHRRVTSAIRETYQSLGAAGQEPVFSVVNAERDAKDAIQSLASRLVEHDRIPPKRLAVLSDSRDFIDSLQTRLAGDHCFVQLGQSGIIAETIHRFKGLEADCLILYLSDRVSTDLGMGSTLAYIGMSRAKSMLFILGSQKVKQFLSW